MEQQRLAVGLRVRQRPSPWKDREPRVGVVVGHEVRRVKARNRAVGKELLYAHIRWDDGTKDVVFSQRLEVLDAN